MKFFLATVIIFLFIGRIYFHDELKIVDAFSAKEKVQLIDEIGSFYTLIIAALILFILNTVRFNCHFTWFLWCGFTYCAIIGIASWYPFLPDAYAYFVQAYFFTGLFQFALIVSMSLIFYLFLCFKNDWLTV